MPERYYSMMSTPLTQFRRPQHETVKGLIDSHRGDYTTEEKGKAASIRLRKEKWRLRGERRLIKKLESVGQKIDDAAETQSGTLAQGEFLWSRQAALIHELRTLDLHSKRCWSRNRRGWQSFLRRMWIWAWLYDGRGDGVQKTKGIVCYC
jgi:hypothetical protein